MLNQEQKQQQIARDIGVYDEMMYSFNGSEVILWHMMNKIEKVYELPYKSEIIRFGQLQSNALHFKSYRPIIMVCGVQNYIHLFGINRSTLMYDDFKVCYKIPNSSYIQQIIFNNNN